MYKDDDDNPYSGEGEEYGEGAEWCNNDND